MKEKVFISISIDPIIYEKLDNITTDKDRLIEWLILNYLKMIDEDVSEIYL